MYVLLKYRQGSHRRMRWCDSVEAALDRAGELLRIDGCSDLQIRSATGEIELDDSQIRHACLALWSGVGDTDITVSAHA